MKFQKCLIDQNAKFEPIFLQIVKYNYSGTWNG